jgi:hypothetical protein
MRTILPLLIAVAAGCPKPPTPVPVEPAPQTRYELASHRCQGPGATCACRDASDPADAPEQTPVPAGQRRLELILASADPAVVVSIDGLPYQLRPNGESPRGDCWYIDVPLGMRGVTLRAREYKGALVQASLQVSEYQPGAGCGSGGDACTPEELTDEKARLIAGLDKCAATRVKGVRWEGALNEGRYLDLDVALELALAEKPDSPDCAP